jgi:hypothetical protein
MLDPFDSMIGRLEADPFFLAAVLSAYARSRDLDDVGLADALGCSPDDLVDLRLCRAPRPDPPEFRADVRRIAARFGLDAGRLADVVRRGQGSLVLRTRRPAPAGLLAARETPSPPSPLSHGGERGSKSVFPAPPSPPSAPGRTMNTGEGGWGGEGA